jgi:hypothetical protein
VKHQVKHFFYASGWKKFEAVWDLLIRARQLTRVTPVLEAVLSRVTRAARRDKSAPREAQQGENREPQHAREVPIPGRDLHIDALRVELHPEPVAAGSVEKDQQSAGNPQSMNREPAMLG